ncbi:hypothetical protein [Campylobacter sp. US33a]|uniref:hypothetical protein n=1 Tax=Campylobacter sp. US33a TaxID=2498120 RepID=UPI0010675F12|nr:hypothetical protein [Campylobacter sp. US33a]TEY00952.1 hypothetical protein ELQ16_08190 [Campylobacter sp. US33a]
MAKKMSLRKHLVLSFVASSMLYNQAIALPQGGNFVQGGGSITSGGGNMNIHGNGNNGNHVINWGGGFNIGKDESVNFSGQGHHKFLNLDYSKNASQIYGQLNGNGHDIFLVNPNGTIIGNGAVINTGKFGISTGAMNEAQIKEFATSGKFSPVFSPAQKGTITIQGDAILNVSNLQLVGNKIVLKDGININLKDNNGQLGSFDAQAQSIELLGGTISANTINLNTTPKDQAVTGEIKIGNIQINDLTKMDLSTKILYFNNANLDLQNAELNANAEQINLDEATLNAKTINFNATNKIKSLGSTLSATDMTLQGTNALEFSNSNFNATNLALLQSNYINLDDTSFTASNLKLQANGDKSLIDITNSKLTANSNLDIDGDQIKFSQGSTLTSKGEANIKANDQIAFEDSELDITKLDIEATNHILFKNSSINKNEAQNKGELSLKSENGTVSIQDSDFTLDSFTLNANQAEFKNSNQTQNTIKANTLDFDLKDKIIAQNYNFNVSNLDWNAGNYIHLNGSKFDLGTNAIFASNQTKIENTTFNGNDATTLEFKGSNTNSIIEVDGGNTNINENINSVKFNANRINIKNGNINAASNLELISDYLDITGGKLKSNDTLKLEGKNYLGVTNSTINAKTLTLLTQNLIELKSGANLNATNIEFKNSENTTKNTQVNIENGATITADQGTLKILLDRINVKGGTLSAKDLNLEGKKIAITGGELKGTTITLKGDELISIDGDTVKIGTDSTTDLNLESGNLIEVKKGALTASKISMKAVDNDPNDGKNRGTIDLLGGTITAKTSDIILIGRDINFGGANISASGKIDADASNLISVSGSGSITGNIDLNAEKEIKINGNLGDENSNITLNTQGQFNVIGGTLKAKDFGVNAGAIDFKNANLKAGSIKFEAQNKILISGDSTKIEGSSLILNSANLIDISGGSLISSGTIKFNDNFDKDTIQEIKISGGTINATGDLSANADGIHISGGDIDGANISFKASNDISISGSTTIDAANITLEGLGANGGIKIDAGTITATAMLKLLANNRITIEGGILSGKSVDIAANGNVENDILKGGLVELKGGTIKATGNGKDDIFSIKGNDIALSNSTLDAAKDLNLEAKNLLNITGGTLKVENGKLILNGDKEVKISGATFTTSKDNTTLEVKSSGKVTYNQTNGTLKINDFTITSGEIDIQGGTIDAKGNVKFTAKTNITFKNATLTTQGGITFKADKGIIVGQKDSSRTTLTANGISFESKNIQIQTATLNAGTGDLKLKATELKEGEKYKEGGIIEISDASELSGNNIDIQGYNVKIQGTNTKLTATQLSLSANNILELKDSKNISAKNATLKAIAKLYIEGATLSMQGNLSLLSANLIDLNNANLSATGNVSFAKIDPDSGLINGKEENQKLGVVATIRGNTNITTNGDNGNISFAVDKVDIQNGTLTASGAFISNGVQFYMSGGEILASGAVDISANNHINLTGGSITGKTLDFLGSNVIDISNMKLTATGGGINITGLNKVNISGDNNYFTTKKGGDEGANTDIDIIAPDLKIDDPHTDIDGDGQLNIGGSESLVYNKLDGSNHIGNKDINLIGTNYLGIFNSTIQGLNVNFISNNFIEMQNSTITGNGNISFSATNDQHDTKISIVNSTINATGDISFAATYLIIKGKQTGLEGSPDEANGKDTTITAGGNITTDGIKEIFIENANLSAGGKIGLDGSMLLRITDSILNANSLVLSSANWIDIAGGKFTAKTGDILLGNGESGNAKVIDITNGAELDAKTNITFNAEQINISKDEVNTDEGAKAESKDPVIKAGGDINLNATNLIRISGGKFNANNIILKGIKGVEIKGDTTSITASGALKFLSDNLINIEGGAIDAGSVQFGATNGDISKLAINLIGGSITSDGVIDLDANTVNITNANLSGASIDFAVAAMLLNGSATLTATGELKINASDNIQIKAGSLIGGNLNLLSGNLIDISGGTLTSNTGAIVLNATNNLNIKNATLSSHDNIDLDSKVISIDNAKIKGTSLDATADNLTLANLTNGDANANFNISGAVSLTGKKYLGITGSTLSFTSLTLASNNLIEIASSNLKTTGGAFKITATDANPSDEFGASIKITDSILSSSDTLNLKADAINLSGATTELNAQNAIDLTAQQIIAENIKQIKSTAGDINLNASNHLKITGNTVRTLIEGLNINIMANNLVEITKVDLTASAGNINITGEDKNSQDQFGTKIVLNDAKLDANSNNANDGKTGNINIQGFDQINVENKSVLDAAYNVLLNASKKIVISGGSQLKALKDLTLSAKEAGISIKDAETLLDAENVNLKGGAIVLENGKIYADNSINFGKADGASNVYVKIDNGELKTGAANDGSAGSIKFGDGANQIDKIEINGGTISTADLDAYARQIAIANGAEISANLLDLSASELLKISGGTITTGTANLIGSNIIEISGGTINVGNTLTMKNANGADNVYINISGGTINAENANLDLDAKFIDFANATLKAKNLDANAYVLNVKSGTFTISEALKFTGSNYIDITGGIFSAKNIDFISNNVISIANASLTTNEGNINISATKGEGQQTSTKVDIKDSTLTASGSGENGKINIGADTINISGDKTKLDGANSVSIDANFNLALSNLTKDALKGNITLKAADSLKITDSVLELTSLTLLSNNYISISGSNLKATNGDITIKGIASDDSLKALDISNSIINASKALNFKANKIYASGDKTEFTSGATLSFIATSLILDGIKSITSGGDVKLSGSNVVQIKGGSTKMDLNFNGNLADINSNNVIEISNADIDMTKGTLRITATDTNNGDNLGTKISIENSDIDIKKVNNGAYGHIEIGADQINVKNSTLNADNKVQLVANTKLVLDTITANAGLNMIFKGLSGGISVNNSTLSSTGDMEFASNGYTELKGGTKLKSDAMIKFYDTTGQTSALVLDGVTISGKSEGKKPSIEFANDSTKITGGSIDAKQIDTKFTARFELLNSAAITAEILNLNASNYLNIANGTTLSASGAITLTAANMAVLAGQITGANISVNGGTTGTIDISGKLESTSGDLNIAGADIFIKNSAVLKAKTNLTLDAENQILIGEEATKAENQPSLSAEGSMTIDGKGQVVMYSGALNASSLAFISQNLIDLNAGTITATNGDITFTASGTSKDDPNTKTGTINLDGTTISANGENSKVKFEGEQLNINAGSVSAKSISADMENKIIAKGGKFNAGTISLDGKNALELNGGENGFKFENAKDLDLISVGKLSLANMSLNANTIDLKSNQIDINGGSITANGALNIDATAGSGNTGGKITVNGGTTFSGSTVNFSARNDINISGNSTITSKSSVQMLAGNWISLDGVTISGTSFKIAGLEGNDLNLAELKNTKINSENMQSIDLAAQSINLQGSDLKASGAIKATATGGTLIIKDTKLESTASNIALSGDKHLQVDGTSVIKGISLSFASKNWIELKGGDITATAGNITLTASGEENGQKTGTIDFSGANVTANGKAGSTKEQDTGSIYANGEQINITGGTITANVDFLVDAENIAKMTGGIVNVTRQLTLDGKNRVEVTGGELGTDINDLVFLTERHIKLGIDITTDNLTLEGEQITLTENTINADNLYLKALKQSGEANKGGIVELSNATLNISTLLDIQARNDIKFSNSNIIAQNAAVKLLAQNNNISITGGSIKSKSLVMQAKNLIDLSNTSVNVSGNDALYIGGIKGEDNKDTSAQQVNITNSDIYANNGITINASNKIKITGENTKEDYLKGNSGKITLNGGEQISISGVTVGGTGIDFKAQGSIGRIDLNNVELWAKNQTVSLQANEGININGGFIKENRGIDFDAKDIELVSTNIESTGKIDLNAQNQLIIDGTTLNAGTADIALNGNNQILVKGTSNILGHALTFLSKNLIDLQSGNITANNGDITFTASNGETGEAARGTIKFGGAVIKATGTGEGKGDIKANAEQVNITGGSVTAENFHAKGNNQVMMNGGSLDISGQLILEGTEKVSVTGDAKLGTEINDLVFLSKKYIELGIDISVANLTLRAQQIRLNGGTFNITNNFFLDAGDKYDWTDAPSEDLKGTQTIDGNQGVVKITNGAVINAGNFKVWGKNWVYVDGGSTINANSVMFDSDNLIELTNAKINATNIDFDAGKAIVVGGGSVIKGKGENEKSNIDFKAQSILLGYTLDKEKGESENEWTKFTAKQDGEGVITKIDAIDFYLNNINKTYDGLVQFGGNLQINVNRLFVNHKSSNGSNTIQNAGYVKDILIEGNANITASVQIALQASNLIKMTGGTLDATTINFMQNSDKNVKPDVEISGGTIKASELFKVNSDDIIISGGTINTKNLDFDAANVIEMSGGKITASGTAAFDAANQITLSGGTITGKTFTFNATSEKGKVVFKGNANINVETLSVNAKQIEVKDTASLSANMLELLAQNLIDITGGTIGADSDNVKLKAQKIAMSGGTIDGAKVDLIATKLFTMSAGNIYSNIINIKDNDGAQTNASTTGTVVEISGGNLGKYDKTATLNIDADKISVSGDAKTRIYSKNGTTFDAKQIAISGGVISGDNIILKGSEKVGISGNAIFRADNPVNGTLKLLSDNLIEISGGEFEIKTEINGITGTGTTADNKSSLTELIITGGAFKDQIHAYAKNINFAGGTVSFENTSASFNASNYLKFLDATINTTGTTALAFNATNSILASGASFNAEAGKGTITFQTTGENGYIGFVKSETKGSSINGFENVSLNSSKGLELKETTINTKNLKLTSKDDMSIASSTLTTDSSLKIDAGQDLAVKDSAININGGIGENDNSIKAGASILFDNSKLALNNGSKASIVAKTTFKALNSQLSVLGTSTLNANAKDIIIEGAKDGLSALLGGGSTLNLVANNVMDLKNATFKHQNSTGAGNNQFNFKANKINANTVSFAKNGDGASVADVRFTGVSEEGKNANDVINLENINVDANSNFTANAQNIDLKGNNSFAKAASLTAQNLLSIAGTLTAKDLSLNSYKELTANAATFKLSGTNNFKANFQRYTNSSFTSQDANSKANINFANLTGGNTESKIEFLTGTNFKDLNAINVDAKGILIKTGTSENQGFISGIGTIDIDASNELKIEGSNINANTINFDAKYLLINASSKLVGNTVKLNSDGYASAYLKIDNATITASDSLTLGTDNKAGSVIDILNNSSITSNKSANIYADAINLKNSQLVLSGSSYIKALSKFLASNDTAKTSIKLSGDLTIDGGREIEFNKANIEKSGDTANMWLRTTNAAGSGNNGKIKIVGSSFGSDSNALDKLHIYNASGDNAGANDLVIDGSTINAKDMIFKLANRIDIKGDSNIAGGKLVVANARDMIVDNSNLNITNIDLALSNLIEFKNTTEIIANYLKVSGKQATFDNANLKVSGATKDTDVGGIFTEQILFKNSIFTLNSGRFAFGNASTKYVKFENNKDSGKGLWVNGTNGGTLTFEGQKIDFINSQLTTNNNTQNINFNSTGDINFNNANFYANGGTTNFYIGSRNNATLNINFVNTVFEEKNGATTLLDIMAKTKDNKGGKVNLAGLKMTNELDNFKVNANWIDIANGADIKAGTVDLSTPGKIVMTGGTITANTFKTSSGAGTGMVFLRGGNLNANTITLGGKEVQILAEDKQGKGTTIHAKDGKNNVSKVTIDTTGYVNASTVFANEIYNKSGWTSMNISELMSGAWSGKQGPKMTGGAKSYLNIATNSNASSNASEWYQFVKWFNDGTSGINSYDQYNLLNDIDFGGANLTSSNSFGIINKFENQTFNGQGHTLNNFRIGDTNNRYQYGTYVGLIREAKNSTFENVQITNAQMYLSGSTITHAGLLVGKADSNSMFRNIKLDNSIVDATLNNNSSAYIGSIVGAALGGSNFEYIDANNITVKGKNNKYTYVGGIVGQTYGNANINHIYISNFKVSAESTDQNSRAFAAGFIGLIGSFDDESQFFTGTISDIVIDSGNDSYVSAKSPWYGSTGGNPNYASMFANFPSTYSRWKDYSINFNNVFINIRGNDMLSVSGGKDSSVSFFIAGDIRGMGGNWDYNNPRIKLNNTHIYVNYGGQMNNNNGVDNLLLDYNGLASKFEGSVYRNTNKDQFLNKVKSQYPSWNNGFYNPDIKGPDTPSDMVVIGDENSGINWNDSYTAGNAKDDVNDAPIGNELDDTTYNEADKITNDNTAGNTGDIIITDGGKYTGANPIDDINHDYNAGNIEDSTSTGNSGLGSINVGPINDLDNSVKDTVIDSITDNNTEVGDNNGETIGDLNDEIKDTIKGDTSTTPKDDIGNVADAGDTTIDKITDDNVDKIKGDGDFSTSTGDDVTTGDIDTSRPEYKPEGGGDTSTGKDESGKPSWDDNNNIQIPDIGTGGDVNTGGTDPIINNPDHGDNGGGNINVDVPEYKPIDDGENTKVDPIIPEDKLPIDPITPPGGSDPIWDIGNKPITGGDKGDMSGSTGAGSNESNDIEGSFADGGNVGGAENTNKDYNEINNGNNDSDIAISGDDTVNSGGEWTDKGEIEDSEYTFKANSVDEKGDVILGEGDFDSWVLNGILDEVKNKFLELGIEDLDTALKLIDSGSYAELGKLLGLNEVQTNEFAQGIDFLKAFYGENGAGSLLAGFADENLKKFDGDVKNLKDVAQNIKNDSFGNKGDDGKYSGGILGDFNEFLKNLEQFKNLSNQLNALIKDLQSGKYGEAGSAGYENAYKKYESLRTQTLSLKAQLESTSKGISDAIAKVFVDSNSHFKIIDKNNVLDTSGLDVPSYEKEQGREEPDSPNSRLFAEDKTDENQEVIDTNGGNIDETAGKQKARLCIVSDNAKAMNPCLAMGD